MLQVRHDNNVLKWVYENSHMRMVIRQCASQGLVGPKHTVGRLDGGQEFSYVLSAKELGKFLSVM